jgi:hypothetical protein
LWFSIEDFLSPRRRDAEQAAEKPQQQLLDSRICG